MGFAIDAYLCSLTRRHINRWDPRITPILSQESQRLFHADARRHRANAQAFPDIGMGRKYFLHDLLAVDVAVHSVARNLLDAGASDTHALEFVHAGT
jgi:hypothetical protein